MHELMAWSESRIVSEVQDPLGLELRVSGRMAGQLLFCVTSITPRARYYSFLPWVIGEYHRDVRGTPADRGLDDWIRLYEKAFALGCYAAREEDQRPGRGVVGTKAARRYWETDSSGRVSLAAFRTEGSLAWDQYGGPLVNLGVFDQTVSAEGEPDDAPGVSKERDAPRLSELGRALADAYAGSLSRETLTPVLLQPDPVLTREQAAAFARRGGVDQVLAEGSADRERVRDLLFHDPGNPRSSHQHRRETLLLLMALTQQAASAGVPLDRHLLGDAVLYGRTVWDDSGLDWSIPAPLERIGRRWRMFTLHNFLAVGLEALLVGLVKLVDEAGTGRIRIESVIRSLLGGDIPEVFRSKLDVRLPGHFGETSFNGLMRSAGIDPADDAAWRSTAIAGPERWLSERWLGGHLRERGWESMSPRSGLAMALVLVCMVTRRFDSMRETDEAGWCAGKVKDPYLDLAPPQVLSRLEAWDGAWRDRPFGDVAMYILDRFVIRQHELLGYDTDRRRTSCAFGARSGCAGGMVEG